MLRVKLRTMRQLSPANLLQDVVQVAAAADPDRATRVHVDAPATQIPVDAPHTAHLAGELCHRQGGGLPIPLPADEAIPLLALDADTRAMTTVATTILIALTAAHMASQAQDTLPAYTVVDLPCKVLMVTTAPTLTRVLEEVAVP